MCQGGPYEFIRIYKNSEIQNYNQQDPEIFQELFSETNLTPNTCPSSSRRADLDPDMLKKERGNKHESRRYVLV